jgi:hypothetical protein
MRLDPGACPKCYAWRGRALIYCRVHAPVARDGSGDKIPWSVPGGLVAFQDVVGRMRAAQRTAHYYRIQLACQVLARLQAEERLRGAPVLGEGARPAVATPGGRTSRELVPA